MVGPNHGSQAGSDEVAWFWMFSLSTIVDVVDDQSRNSDSFSYIRASAGDS